MEEFLLYVSIMNYLQFQNPSKKQSQELFLADPSPCFRYPTAKGLSRVDVILNHPGPLLGLGFKNAENNKSAPHRVEKIG